METFNDINAQPLYKERPMPSMMAAVKTCLRDKYATFSGRARRSEYWWFMLFQYIISAAIGILTVVSSIAIAIIIIFRGGFPDEKEMYLYNPGIWLYIIFILAFMIPSIAVACRRLHDINKSGKLLLIPFVASPVLVIGSIVLAVFYNSLWVLVPVFYLLTLAVLIIMIVWMATKGKPEINKWGPSPKYYRD
ncbi:MAG: DUF805 domain-containing protein [Bacteroidales bacterium]|nr:DUF805 domain-containing protein [Bacteroidales bacterium]